MREYQPGRFWKEIMSWITKRVMDTGIFIEKNGDVGRI